jgi:amino acid adenylation domain-containing protein
MNPNPNMEAVHPLSPIQHGMLFHTLLAPDSGTYFNQLHGVIEGNVDMNALDAAWQHAAATHAILRTAFAWEGLAEPLQVVMPEVKIPSTRLDWRGLSSRQQQARLGKFLMEDRRQGFRLSEAPLMRFAMMQLDDNRYQFVWSHHHLLMDAWSMSVLLQEVFECYGRLSAGAPVSATRARPYGDYVRWLRRQDLSASEAYWRAHLNGFESPTPLPGERTTRSADNSADDAGYTECSIHLSERTTAALQELARGHQLTVNTLAQAAWAVLLSSYSGNPDVVFGSVTSTRPPELPGAEKMLGPFINTLPVRVHVSSEPLLQWLKAFQSVQADSRQHHHASLIDVHGWSSVPRDTPMFESIVVFENSPEQALASGGLSLRMSDIGATERTSFPLTLLVGPGEKLLLKLMYETDRFEKASVKNTLKHLANILTGMCDGLERPISELSMLSDAERQRLLVELNDTATEYGNDPVHRLFETCVEKTPDAAAVIDDGASVSYAELNRRANQLAHHLQSLGVGPEVLVAIALDRPFDTLVAILATVKAGGAYLPLDLSYPADRISFMLADARPGVMVCRTSTALLAPSVPVVNLDTDQAIIAAQPATNVKSDAGLENAAYVMYTSGSTGRPKGTVVRHRGILRLVSNTNYIRFEPSDRMAQVSNMSFDAATFEIWGTLTSGGSLVMIGRDVSLSPRELAVALRKHGITTMFLTAALFHQIAAETPDAFNEMKHLLVGGQAVDPRWARKVLEAGGPTRLVNGYGPTESTTFAVWHLIDEAAAAGASVPIGRPLANTQTYVLDQNLNPVPAGVFGELYIAGDGLARNYLGRPDMTAERFVPNPFAGIPGDRLYRTGDIARYLPDGSIDFRGRKDGQIKMRGYRIELGEIEAVLNTHPSIRDLVVVTREPEPGDLRIVAYVVADSAGALSATELREFLRERVPDYMVPSMFVFLEALPLNANGKLDRNALPASDSEQSRHGSTFRAPRTVSEELLAGLFADVLGIEGIGIDDSFFDLGGHSLLATRLISRVRSAFRVDLPVRAIFESPSVAALAARIDTAAHATDPQITKFDRSAPIPASDQQRRMFLVDKLEEMHRSIHNTPFVLRLKGTLHREALDRSLNEIVRRHDVMRTTLFESAGTVMQSIQPFEPFALPVVDLSHLPAGSREAAAMEMIGKETQTIFDLEKGPIYDARLFLIDEDQNILYVNVHHVATDVWSLRIFFSEMSALYAAFSKGEPSPLDEPALQYADFAAWQSGMMKSGAFDKQLDYWRNNFESSIEPAEPPYTIGPAAGIDFEVAGDMTQELSAFAKREGVTNYMILLAAFHLLLRLRTGTSDSVVGTPLNNRMRAETENMIGLFANTAALRARISDEMTGRDLLEHVRESVLTTFVNQEVVPDSIRGLSADGFRRTPFCTWFAYDQFAGASCIEALPCEFIDLPAPSSTPLHLTARFRQDQETLSGRLEYRQDIFADDQAPEMIRELQMILESLVFDPGQTVSELLSLAAEVRGQTQQTDEARV